MKPNPNIKYCAEEVFREMGSGHSEAVYENCLALEMLIYFGEPHTRQVPCTLKYKGYSVGVGFIDILFNDTPIEIKAVTKLTPKDEQQVRKYLEALDLDYGLLINFGNNLEIVEVQKGEHDKTPSSED
jgi:GxxExxY protein